MFLAALVCLSACYNLKSYRQILMKFYENVQNGTRKRCFDIDGDPDHCSYPGIV